MNKRKQTSEPNMPIGKHKGKAIATILAEEPSYLCWFFETVEGYGVSLDAAARGMGIKGKPEGMNGAVAPVLWAEGRREEELKYVAGDTRTTLDLATECEARGALRWVARSGKLRTMRLPEGWLTADEALELPLPNTSWMDEPWPRERFTGWMG